MTRNPSSRSSNGPAAPFAGFALPTSNTTYTPNQFFDVCLPHYPRGVVRLVGYIIRKTLGWCDENGQPLVEKHAISYAELERKAGISRDMIHGAIEGAVEGHFIRCTRQPKSKKAGVASVSGQYELRWDEKPAYVKNPTLFRGFFAGEGNRTYIPNQFFDLLVPRESLAVSKVVGSVIRFSIGFQNKWGHRRRNVALSYQHIQNYSKLRDRKTLSDALKHALSFNYIERVEEGFFDPNGGRLSKTAVYAVKWLNQGVEQSIGQKTPPAKKEVKNQSEIPTGIGQKTQPADRSEIPTGIEIKQLNKTFKQQETVAAAFSKLKAEGFDSKAAQAIASTFSLDRIERQIQLLASRKVRANRLGMLRAAIEQDWPQPASGLGRQLGEPNLARPAGAGFGQALEEARQRLNQFNNSSS
jgi:hypothetical protein